MSATRLEPGMEILNPTVAARVRSYASEYRDARPFMHIVIDDFLNRDLARALLAEFPTFEIGTAVVEYGAPSKKVAVPRIEEIGPAYATFNAALATRPFLDWLGELTGIDDLQMDRDHFGGGTHENLEGTELDPHVDFNIHPKTGLHRRLNLIVYLNVDWEPDWGGAIEVHLDPRDPANDESKAYAPLFNRCIIFETSERSWHGFRRIVFPAEQKRNSRKSISIYLYTKTRPAATIAPSHSTIFIQRPLAEFVRVGDIVTPEMMENLSISVQRRDDSIRDYQQRELADSRRFDALKTALDQYAAAVLVSTCGPVSQRLGTGGIFPDGWVSKNATIALRARADVIGITVAGWVPGFAREPNQVHVACGENRATVEVRPGEAFEAFLPLGVEAGTDFDIVIDTALPVRPCDVMESTDERELAFLIDRVSAQ